MKSATTVYEAVGEVGMPRCTALRLDGIVLLSRPDVLSEHPR